MSNSIENNQWQPDSWRTCQATQQPLYTNEAHLQSAIEQLSSLPPLVTSWEVESLKNQLAAAQRGEAFLLQGGDCAESFDECTSDNVVQKLKILLQMSLVLATGFKKPVIRVGRIAGQYAKPRSADEETRDGVSLPSYRGDLINRMPFTVDDRIPDPELMLRGYERAALTLNFVRSLIDGGFADLHHPENWDLDFVGESPMSAEYNEIVKTVSDSLEFFESIAGDVVRTRRVEFYTSHEGLHLPYEQAQTRFLSHRERWYNLTTHYPWIGMRTADISGAHVEYFKGISNPMGIKISATVSDEHLQELIQKLNPNNEPGRLTFITRFGASNIEDHLPRVIEAAKKTGSPVLWVCDPMHGNTETTTDGYKTRRFDNIITELQSAFRIHTESGSHLGGVHLELTGENVTECIGGARGLNESDLAKAYKSQVDPRLNYEQAMEVAMRIAGQFNG
ncbi:MAG: 3-deoxy-7-phosphoheptulonate synthase class II [Rhodospirillaceae bacterium]|nr:3-deoxy-7-phosphoheptulonate synthase class II [Rhodospirillaceae bacterium]|tara:strand:- start:1082 stop:2431 length:1350 start_codon:yes stop_codon:yes gene_type:complete